ncbi:hypothetical protein IJG90_03025 [Candidatus Saccharibacteria bacterium]|nr:hypothetical protein [Candidatus Saccharibacteria bacterium]
MKKWRCNWRKWCDEWVLAGKGLMLATREKKFLVGFFLAFLAFGTLINLLAGGTSKFQLMAAVGMPGALQIVGSAFIGVFGVNMIFGEWITTFLLAGLQGALIGLIVLLWDKKRVHREQTAKMTNVHDGNAENVEKAGIVAGLIALGAGCPTCGTTLLTPLIGAIFSTGSLAVTGVITGIMTVAAVIIALLSLKKLGLETYAIIVNEKYLAKRAKSVKRSKTDGRE